MSLSDVSGEFSSAGKVIYEMKQTMNAVGFDELGDDVSEFQDEG